MKTARHVLGVMGTILGLFFALFIASNNADDKKWALRFFVFAIAAWFAYIFLLVKSQYHKDDIDLRVTPKGKLLQSSPTEIVHDATPSPSPIKEIAPPYTEYNQDVFANVIWGWHYKPAVDNTPRGIEAYCIECEDSMPLEAVPQRDRGGRDLIALVCPMHQVVALDIGTWPELYKSIREQIQVKLNDGTWREVVNKYRVLKGQVPLSSAKVFL